MLLTVDGVKPTAKSLVLTCAGKEYFAKKASGIMAGMTIDAETTVSDYNGKQYVWVEKWKQVPNAGGYSPNPPHAPSAQPHQSAANGALPVWANFVSNQVAHAIQAGCIKDPTEIKVWAAAAKQAFVELLT